MALAQVQLQYRAGVELLRNEIHTVQSAINEGNNHEPLWSLDINSSALTRRARARESRGEHLANAETTSNPAAALTKSNWSCLGRSSPAGQVCSLPVALRRPARAGSQVERVWR